MDKNSKQGRKEYVKPEIKRVIIEDQHVVAMGICKDDVNDRNCFDEAGSVTDRIS